MIDELDIPCDPDISSVFNRDDAYLSTICVLIELPYFTVVPSRRPPPPPWSQREALVLILRPPPWPD